MKTLNTPYLTFATLLMLIALGWYSRTNEASYTQEEVTAMNELTDTMTSDDYLSQLEVKLYRKEE